MRIIDIPQYRDRKELLIMEQDCSVFDAVVKMKELNFGSVIVTNNAKLCGIFTERDLLTKVAANKLDSNTLKLEQVMTQNVKTAYSDDGVYESTEIMLQGGFRHMPIIDRDNKLIGMVSQRDFVAISWRQIFEQLKNKTKSSFFSFSSIWMLALGMLMYSVLIFFIFSWLAK